MDTNTVSIPQLTVEQKLAIREVQYTISRAERVVKESSSTLQQLVHQIAIKMGVDSQSTVFNLDTLEFIPHR